MSFPGFFDFLPPIITQDDLAVLLGASQDGIFIYTYHDIVKLAGHSCPTTAGAYLMLREGLKTLYPDTLPRRGEIRVELKGAATVNATGVVGAIATLVTGAADEKGFQGLGGHFSRHNLLSFERPIPMAMRLTRTDCGETVDIGYDPSLVTPNSRIPTLLEKVRTKSASDSELKTFGTLWQKRVEEILMNEYVVKVQKGS